MPTAQLTPLRYTSPTVTLEVMAREAAVSQWSDKPVVQILRYQLQIQSLIAAEPTIEIRGDRASFLPLAQAVQDYVQRQLAGEDGVGDQSVDQPFLEPLGLTQHTLHLGPLRTQTGDASIVLGAIQLADLEQVLDQLETAVRPLPIPLARAPQRRAWQQWGAIAASMVAAIGVTTTLWSNYQPQQNAETALEAPVADSAPPASPQIESDRQSPQPAPTTEALDDLAEAPETDDESAVASAPRSPAAKPPAASPPPTTDNQPKNEGASTPAATQPQDFASDRPETASSTPPAPARSSDERADTAESAPVDVSPPAEPEAPVSGRSQRSAAANSRPEIAPENAPAVPPASPPVTEELETGDFDAAETFGDHLSEALTSPELGVPQPASAPAPGSLTELVQQVRDRWEPPAELDQTLTYTLTFAADGTLIEVMPADELAAQYRDRPGIPSVGTAVLPPGDPQRVLLLLHPDGNVELKDAGPF